MRCNPKSSDVANHHPVRWCWEMPPKRPPEITLSLTVQKNALFLEWRSLFGPTNFPILQWIFPDNFLGSSSITFWNIYAKSVHLVAAPSKCAKIPCYLPLTGKIGETGSPQTVSTTINPCSKSFVSTMSYLVTYLQILRSLLKSVAWSWKSVLGRFFMRLCISLVGQNFCPDVWKSDAWRLRRRPYWSCVGWTTTQLKQLWNWYQLLCHQFDGRFQRGSKNASRSICIQINNWVIGKYLSRPFVLTGKAYGSRSWGNPLHYILSQ